jgi:DNA-binding CsgD family transcriptional regulator
MSQLPQLDQSRLQSLVELLLALDHQRGEPERRASAMLAAVTREMGAKAGILVQAGGPDAASLAQARVVSCGLEPAERDRVIEQFTEPQQHPLFQPLQQTLAGANGEAGPLIMGRADLLSDQVWAYHPLAKWCRRSLEIDDCLLAIRREPGPEHLNMLTLHRSVGALPFDGEDRELVRLFWKAAGRQFCPRESDLQRFCQGQAHHDPAAGLSPRQREVFQFALTGFGAQQIAERLGLSVYTVYEHMQRLYQTLGVANRQELIATYAPPMDHLTNHQQRE